MHKLGQPAGGHPMLLRNILGLHDGVSKNDDMGGILHYIGDGVI